MKHLLLCGFGYVARCLTEQLYHKDICQNFTATVHSEASGAAAYSVNAVPFDELDLSSHSDITHILLSIPPSALGDPTCNKYLSQLVKLKNLKWIGYLSSTGVYGNHNGGWVTEQSPLNIEGAHNHNRRLAEQQWLQALREHSLPVHIFRLSGIYGPNGRSAFDSILAGISRIIDEPTAIFSRVHVTDIAQVLTASMLGALAPGSIYNVADDYPCNPGEVIRLAHKLLGLSAPKLIALKDAGLSEMGLSFYRHQKRVNNAKLKRELNYQFLYPTYESGLRAIARVYGYKI